MLGSSSYEQRLEFENASSYSVEAVGAGRLVGFQTRVFGNLVIQTTSSF